ncbi:hypothetical protein LVD15_18695 [Fulvivirga maritima]|uniref:hypothetical protein n=1 Tax=Fulvivirga maritima TaxID=2904247 RepID=UPI001F2B60D0|nr:hypothetical protein [Fulvivirga maritima]UII25319.1 hypothetical protein LVD15_18695 [Fulvivirga maritima]
MLLFYSICFCVLTGMQAMIPFREADSYDMQVQYSLKEKPASLYQQNNGKVENSILPHLALSIDITSVKPEEFRVNVISGHGGEVMSKRLKKPIKLMVSLGFTDDIFDNLKPDTYHIYFSDKDGDILSQLKVQVKKDKSLHFNDQFVRDL